jgi:bla regulator protein BlaR1
MNLIHPASALTGLFHWTWKTSLEASVLVMLVCVLQWFCRRWLSPQGRFALSSLVVLRLLMPAVPVSSWSVVRFQTALSPLARVQPVFSSGPTFGLGDPGDWESKRIDSMSARAFRPGLLLEQGLALIWLAGMLTAICLVWRQHVSFARWLRLQQPAEDAAILELLDACKQRIGIAKPIQLMVVQDLPAPALFGWRRPQLLLPKATLAVLRPAELRLVFLHELAHVRSHDLLLNWLIILLRSWHWFNPLVTRSLDRLRADREAICDATVLHLVEPSEHSLYGETLLKLLARSAEPRFSPNLLSAVTNKRDIKRRIMMIAQFSPSRRAATVLGTVLALVLCCFTFTRAAEQKKHAPSDELKLPVPPSNQPATQSGERGIKILEQKLREQDRRVLSAQKEVDELRRKLGTPDPGSIASGTDAFALEGIRTLERDRIVAESRKASYVALLDQLQGRSMADLRQVLPTAVPDALLNGLLERLSIAETDLARLSVDHGPEFPEAKAIAAGIANLNKQIDARTRGIFDGLRAQIASAEATSDRLRKSIAEAKEHDAQLTEEYRPYFEAKRELETQRRIQETLRLRLIQEISEGPQP